MTRKIRLPGMIDVHVHMRVPGGEHKEDWITGTSAALAGGITSILAMPNTSPAIVSNKTLMQVISSAQTQAYCDFGQFIGAGQDNYNEIVKSRNVTPGVKMYLDQTYGPLRLVGLSKWIRFLDLIPSNLPVAVHAEGATLAAVVLLSSLKNRPVHLCHVSRRDEILIIKRAKEMGAPVTCEVTPHHLLLCEKDIPSIGSGRAEVRPTLATEADREALWENIEVIDCIATDHAPHTLEEKDSKTPPPGFPGLETALPLLLTEVERGRITLDDLVRRFAINPRRIYNLPLQKETYVEIEYGDKYSISSIDLKTKCGWSPFDGWKVKARVASVWLRNTLAYHDGEILVQPGFGKNLYS